MKLDLLYFSVLCILFDAQLSISTVDNIIRVDELEEGMMGHGLTVFHGVLPEKFDVVVIGVLKNSGPMLDTAIIKCLGPKFETRTVSQGMSGSPVYFNDRLAGAIAFGWSGVKEPYIGITLIEEMLDDLNKPERTNHKSYQPEARPNLGMGHGIFNYPQKNDYLGDPKLKISKSATNSESKKHDGRDFITISTPVYTTGLTETGIQFLKNNFARDKISFQTNQASDCKNATTQLKPGSAIAVSLVDGDIKAYAVGTVVYVDGNKVGAFGHSFYNLDSGEFPMSTACVHDIIPLIDAPFKLASKGKEIGAIVRDRKTGVLGIVGKKAPLMPFSINFDDSRGIKHKYNFDVIKNELLTPGLLNAILLSILERGEGTAPDTILNYKIDIKIKRRKKITLENRQYLDAFTSGTVVLNDLNIILNNPFIKTELDSINLALNANHDKNIAYVTKVWSDNNEAERGKRIKIYYKLTKFNEEKDIIKSVEIDVPLQIPAGRLKVRVFGGGTIPYDTTIEHSFSELVSAIKKRNKSNDVIVVAQFPEGRVKFYDKNLDFYPPTFQNIINTRGETRLDRYPLEIKKAIKTDYVVFGKQEYEIKIKK